MSAFDDPPLDLEPWERAGFTRSRARQWLRWRFTLREAEEWRRAGVEHGLTAAQWRTSGVVPETVDDWRNASIGPDEAVRWYEFGIGLTDALRLKSDGHGPESPQARRVSMPHDPLDPHREAYQRFRDAGVPVDVVVSYQRLAWFDDEALRWARHTISADHARTWTTLGLEPGEAAALDAEPGVVAREWWRAGIPHDEVADWIGAGFSAQEAVRRREAGMSARDAAQERDRRRLDG